MWQHLTLGEEGIENSQWPKPDLSLIAADTSVDIVVQINGKTRGHINTQSDVDKSTLEQLVMQNDKFKTHLEGKTIKRVIYIPQKLINVVAV